MKNIEKELNENPQKESIDYQDIMKRKTKKDSDPLMKLYIKGEKQLEEKMQDMKTLEQDNPNYERFTLRTTRNVSNYLVDFLMGRKQC